LYDVPAPTASEVNRTDSARAPHIAAETQVHEAEPSRIGKKLMPSKHLEMALTEAEKHPLDDLACRLVVASPCARLILDVPFSYVDSLLGTLESQGIDACRAVSAQTLAAVASGANVGSNWVVAMAVLAYFDRPYLRSGRRPWNTLALDVEVRGTQVIATRRSYALEYPTGAIDLNADPLGLKSSR
jgi:hypothetical protein